MHPRVHLKHPVVLHIREGVAVYRVTRWLTVQTRKRDGSTFVLRHVKKRDGPNNTGINRVFQRRVPTTVTNGTHHVWIDIQRGQLSFQPWKEV